MKLNKQNAVYLFNGTIMTPPPTVCYLGLPTSAALLLCYIYCVPNTEYIQIFIDLVLDKNFNSLQKANESMDASHGPTSRCIFA